MPHLGRLGWTQEGPLSATPSRTHTMWTQLVAGGWGVGGGRYPGLTTQPPAAQPFILQTTLLTELVAKALSRK